MSLDSSAAASYKAFFKRLAEGDRIWWDSVILTASNLRQADRYREEIELRRREGRLPEGVRYLVVPDPGDRRVGSGSATIFALAALWREVPVSGRENLWSQSRILMIHSGGDSRRLPQYSPQGKLFGIIPSPRGNGSETTSVFDETMALSTAWAERMPPGLLVMSGDVLLEFESEQVDWNRPGVTGVGMRLPIEVGSQHGVYAADENGRVYTFLQKPSQAEAGAAGALLDGGRVAVDTGLLRFDPAVTARLAGLAEFGDLPVIDLYEVVTKGLTGQWKAPPDSGPVWSEVESVLHGVPFHCSVLDGKFTHVGTTRHFRAVAAGGVMDSVVVGGCELEAEAVVVECELTGRVRARRGAILHGLSGIDGLVEVPENTVVHKVPVLTGDGRRGVVIRVYGVEDDPKATQASGNVTWFGRPAAEVFQSLGIRDADVWPDISVEERSLWNAALFPLTDTQEAWTIAQWMFGGGGSEDLVGRWLRADRMSLAQSSLLADGRALSEARNHRLQLNWQTGAIALSKVGTDLRPMLAQAPGSVTLASTGRALRQYAASLESQQLTEAASQAMQATRFLRRAGLEEEAEQAEAEAMRWVAEAVSVGAPASLPSRETEWRYQYVEVAAPARIDLGGGWSDTPPFCQDWGGTVLNIAMELDGDCPIKTQVRRIEEPLIRCISEGTEETVEWTEAAELLQEARPGSTAAVPMTSLRMNGLLREGETLESALRRRSGGLEIRTSVHLPVGSGLGVSSILAATVVRSISEMQGISLSNHELSDEVMRLEQALTTGGGWQDQAGGIFPGAKVLSTGPGLLQRIRVRPVVWTPDRQTEFEERLVLCATGIQRLAKNLLKQVVGSYLLREASTIQVLHSIKTLAGEMAYAMEEGEWAYLGNLLDRHWELNLRMDPHMTNAPINALLEEVRPLVHGAKLAGAGGGGFMILLAKGPEEARLLKRRLGDRVSPWRISEEGLRVRRG